ncbi:BTAD domain-containing putative transcriptional regulator [Streptomyces sp. HPF1205]|uniref:AfsR/SARP family transcriptional regulator n=1 Tax=Streptomyces sp. HPF1205 TaxID=2873262 RepID=UPI001CED18C6|nr:BTAD domain-containing putative transcriptional regulator [Streptomyces sp. HPF1205]
MRFGILGATRVLGADGCEVALGGPRRRATLALLLLDAGRVVGVERLVDGLYGEDAPAGVGNAVQSQISRLRQVLPVAVEGHPAGYRLVVEPDEVDVHRFTRLSAAGREALAEGAAEKAEELLAEALELWRGPALADVRDAPFAAAQVVRLEELRVAALEDRAEARLALGRHRELVAELGELVASHPLRERLRGQLMRALYGSGRQSEALAAYEAARRELADSLGADPGPELAAVHLAVLRGDPSLMPDVPRGTSASAPRAASILASTPPSTAASAPRAVPNAASAAGDSPEPPPAPRHELPAQLTSFVGRAAELGRIGEQLASGRLVTLIGPGGAGKTRLAVEAAGRYAHDAAFVELAGLTAGADVPQAVLGALGLREGGLLAPGGPGGHAAHPPAAAGPPDPVARIAAALDGRPALLVLDNCEHLVADAAALAERLLAAVPGLRVLATSREALGINGETLCPVAPLEVPPPGTGTEQALTSPAVRLFTDRAKAVRPDFDPAADPEAVVRLCTVLDGLPLAIELAAARLRSMSVTEIAARLGTPADDALPYSLGVRPDALFRLLSRGSRTAQPRQRTLRAVVDWSWDLLPEDERAVLRRASVFAGGWTLEAAEAVCADPGGPADSREGAGIAPDDVLDVVAALVEKSLCLAQPPDPAGRVRYRMLESIRAYGAERLAEAGETAATRRAHTAYFLDFALTADPYLRGPAQLDWLRRLSDDRDNLHAALHRSLADGDIPTAMRLIAALSSYWLLRGMRYEGVEPARRVLAAVGPHPPEGMEEEYALCVMAVVSTLPDAREYAEHVAAAAAVVEAGHRLARRYPALTLLWAPFAGVPERSPETEAGIDRFLRETGDPWYRALIHLGHGFQAWVIGADAETARRECETSLEGFRRQGERWGMITCLGVLADLADYQGDLRRAVALLGQAQVLAEELDSALDMADLLCNRAARSLRAGDHAAATAFCERAVELSRRAGAPETLAMAHLGLAEAARLRGDLAAARELGEQALAECPVGWFSSNGTRLSVLLGLGRICVAEGDAAGARRCFGEAVAAERLAAQFPLAAAAAAAAVAGLALLEGDPRAAACLLGVARSLRGRAAGGPDADAAEAAARDALGGDAYEEALAAARALPRDEALGVLHRYLGDA